MGVVGEEKINSFIKDILLKSKANWTNETLYSWSWGLGTGYLEARHVYDDKFSKFTEKPLVELSTSDTEGLSAKLYERIKKSWILPNQNYFILEMLVEGDYIKDSHHLVVSNMRPDTNTFSKGALHAAIGKWYVGFE
jgi:hypothetical protein